MNNTRRQRWSSLFIRVVFFPCLSSSRVCILIHSHTFSYILHFSLSLSPPILKDMQQVYVEPLETDRETGRGTWESSLLSWMRGGVPLQGPPARDAARGLKDHVVRSGWSGRPPISIHPNVTGQINTTDELLHAFAGRTVGVGGRHLSVM